MALLHLFCLVVVVFFVGAFLEARFSALFKSVDFFFENTLDLMGNVVHIFPNTIF